MRSSRHIIIADDDDGIRALLARIIVRLYPVIAISAVNDGVDALAAYARHPADLLITNLDMPRMNGLDLVSTLRTGQAPLPIVMVSADISIEQQALAAGVNRFVAKPFRINQISKAVTELLPP